jgi:hypothetical protein
MALCCGRTRIEVLIYKLDANVRPLLKNPHLVALRRVDIFGLHNDWCANLTLLAHVCIECKNEAPSYMAWGGCRARPIPGQGRGKSIWLGVVRIPSFVISRVHRSVLGSLYPLKITLPLYMTSHFSLSKTTLHPTLHRGQIPMSKAVLRSRMMCPVSVMGNPGILMSHACVDLTFLPSGRLMVRGFVANRLFATSTLSITKMEVAPISAMAWFGAMVIALIYCGFGMPYMVLATAATDVGSRCGFLRLLVAKFDMTTVTSSWSAMETTLMFSVGFRNEAETKLLHLCAISTPHCQNCPGCFGSLVLCIPLVHGAHPWLIHCCAFPRVNPT